MKLQAKALEQRFVDIVIASRIIDNEFSRIDPLEAYHAESLVFVSDKNLVSAITENPPAVIVTSREIFELLDVRASSVLAVDNVRLAQARMKQVYADYEFRDSEWASIHPSAIIHASAQLADGVMVGPGTVIGKDAKIGSGTIIRANCVIEHGVTIGEECVLNSLVNVGYNCVLADRVVVRPGTIIGNEGFGFAQDERKRYHRIPHTGIVRIADDVQIGANCNIDRGTYGETTISRGVKIDALCHIAHNVFIDEDALFVAQSGVAGSSKVGKRVIASGQTGVIDHRTIADDAVLVHRCGVTEDVTSSGMWAGTPPRPFKEYVRNLSLSKKIEKLERQLVDLKGQLEVNHRVDSA